MSNKPIAVQAFEVKFVLAAARVLGPGCGPTAEVASALKIAGDPEEFRVAFLDGPHLDFHTERWNVRFRDKGGKPEVSVKRRLPVYHGSVAGVLDTALRQGFDADEQKEGYEAEIEWGPVRKTLTLLREEKVSGNGLPDTARAAAKLAAGALPGKLRKWVRDGWADSVLAVAHLYGPVPARRWTWSAVEGKTAFEVWDVRAEGGTGTDPVVEVSLKAADEATATTRRNALLAILARHPDWRSDEDLLKTDRVLSRYRQREGLPA